MRNRELPGDLSRAAWETVRALMTEAAANPGVRPGMVVVPQTFGSSVNAHPHVHAIASRGGWTKDGTKPAFLTHPVPCCSSLQRLDPPEVVSRQLEVGTDGERALQGVARFSLESEAA